MAKTKVLPKAKKPMSMEDIGYNIIFGILFTLLALLCAYPFYYLLICTISNNQMVEVGAITWRPVGIHFGNYKEILKVENLGNSVLITRPGPSLEPVSVCLPQHIPHIFSQSRKCGGKNSGTGSVWQPCIFRQA